MIVSPRQYRATIPEQLLHFSVGLPNREKIEQASQSGLLLIITNGARRIINN